MDDTTNIARQVKGISASNSFPFHVLFPDLLWILFWLLLLFITKDFIKAAITTLLGRLKHGAGVKIGMFELASLNVTSQKVLKNNKFEVTTDEKNAFGQLRYAAYQKHRWIMPVHKIFKSQKEGQFFDVLIYLVPHRETFLVQVKSVEYYFGRHWGNQIFKTHNRSNNFAIVTSAYGPFLCVIKLHFDDATTETVYRYIDFEMGDVASLSKDE